MKAKLLPLEDDYKYEGTRIKVDFEDGYEDEIIVLYQTGDLIPSERVRQDGETEEEYSRQLEVWVNDPEYTPTEYEEDRIVYKRAIELINAINNYSK